MLSDAGQYGDLAPDLLVECRGGVRLVTMNGPERLNSVNLALHRALRLVWERLVDDAEARAVVLTGAGRAFSAGGHYPDLLNNHRDYDTRRRSVREGERLARAMIDCELPVVAAVNGPAVGLGASLAAMSDIVVMADSAYLADPHVTVGVVAGDGGGFTWPLQTSLLRAKEYLFLGDRIPADECLRVGLANRVVPVGDVVPTALALAERLAAQPAIALRDTKRSVNMLVRQAADAVLSFALVAERESFTSPDIRATVEQFQSRPPAPVRQERFDP
jgi:enoyl-CoA hydratase